MASQDPEVFGVLETLPPGAPVPINLQPSTPLMPPPPPQTVVISPPSPAAPEEQASTPLPPPPLHTPQYLRWSIPTQLLFWLTLAMFVLLLLRLLCGCTCLKWARERQRAKEHAS